MKVGIIIIFHDNEKEIDKNSFIKQLNKIHNLEICLVNNNSKDQTYHILKELKDSYTKVSIVNIKKLKSDKSAVRAGARYMSNKFNLKHMGYVSINTMSLIGLQLNDLINAIVLNQEGLFKYSSKMLEEQQEKQTLFKTMFSVLDYVKQLKNVKLISQ